MNVQIICVGKLKEKFYAEAVAEYQKRLGGYCKFQIVELPEEK
ncbi:MAG: 23S rRNA (pseudouridine(1915)-N(3))-methyltransferase RlmH, partial [Oscillospiraceae bacterium]|nr:23S rRNA (pseudouridine(1915)-N(3))-methyltransferase RlmH [Oscillospiraceae bacterium]